MAYKLWLGACIVCIIILTVSLSLIGLYGFDVFDYTDDTYNQYTTMALFGLSIVSAIGLYATANKLFSKEDVKISSQTEPVNPMRPIPYRRADEPSFSPSNTQPTGNPSPPLQPPSNIQPIIKYDLNAGILPPPSQQPVQQTTVARDYAPIPRESTNMGNMQAISTPSLEPLKK